MSPLVEIGIVALSVPVALAGARGVLWSVLRLMAGPIPVAPARLPVGAPSTASAVGPERIRSLA